MIRVISLGAGVQSSTMALMAAVGDLVPMPDCAIFADTGWEPKAVYDWLGWLETQLPFPVYRVSVANIRADIVAKNTSANGRFAAVPWFTEGGMGRRQCTKEYKLVPIRRKVRQLLGGKTPAGGCEMWIGISTDEAARMKPSTNKYIVNRWPLIEDRLSRNDCLRWMERQRFATPPKSSCIGCPFHNDAHWRKMKNEAPDEFADAVEIDRMIRDGGTQRGIRGKQYMHRRMIPLDQVDLSTAEDHGQLNMFINECEGMCGV